MSDANKDELIRTEKIPNHHKNSSRSKNKKKINVEDPTMKKVRFKIGWNDIITLMLIATFMLAVVLTPFAKAINISFEKPFQISNNSNAANLYTFIDINESLDIYTIFFRFGRENTKYNNYPLFFNLSIDFDQDYITPYDVFNYTFNHTIQYSSKRDISDDIILWRGKNQKIRRMELNLLIKGDFHNIDYFICNLFGYNSLRKIIETFKHVVMLACLFALGENLLDVLTFKGNKYTTFQLIFFNFIAIGVNPFTYLGKVFDNMYIYIICSGLFMFSRRLFDLYIIETLTDPLTKLQRIMWVALSASLVIIDVFYNNDENIDFIRYDLYFKPIHYISIPLEMIFVAFFFFKLCQIRSYNHVCLEIIIVLFTHTPYSVLSLALKYVYIFSPYQMGFMMGFIKYCCEIILALGSALFPFNYPQYFKKKQKMDKTPKPAEQNLDQLVITVESDSGEIHVDK